MLSLLLSFAVWSLMCAHTPSLSIAARPQRGKVAPTSNTKSSPLNESSSSSEVDASWSSGASTSVDQDTSEDDF